jgi:hypothetical protein
MVKTSMKPSSSKGRSSGSSKSDGRRKISKKVQAAYLRRQESGNITNLVSPYYVNMEQRNLLSHLLGKDQVSHMEMLNALTYSGMINSKCPPVNEPHKTEEYLNLLTGERECREPQMNVNQYFGVSPDNCPNKYGDPLAVEHYVDFWGRGQCRRPVMSGKFTCPPSDNPRALKHVTLRNGVGICVEDSYNQTPFVMPSKLVYPRDINNKLIEYLSMYKDMDMDLDSIVRLNEIFVSSSGKPLQDIRSKLESDPMSVMMSKIASKLKTSSDPKYANYALVYYLKNRHPSDYAKIINDPTKYLRAMGVSGSMINKMNGGRRRKRSKKGSKKARRSKKRSKKVSKKARRSRK